MRRLLIILFFLMLIGCNNDSPAEAINDKWSGEVEVIEIIDKQKMNKGSVVFFTAKDIDDKNASELAGVAILTGHDNDGWKLIDSSIDSVSTKSISFRHKILHAKIDGESINIPVAFGKLVDQNISSLEAKINNDYKEIGIFTTDLGRYFYQVNAWYPIKALDKDGEVIDQRGY